MAIKNTTRTTCIGSISKTEYNALKALYNATGGNDWQWDPHSAGIRWFFPSPLTAPCAELPWQRITCDVAPLQLGRPSCVIATLNLTKLGLTGQLPPEIGNFSFIHTLRIDVNNITGQSKDIIFSYIN